jgi:putative ABC transport system substrate-binding protein
VQRQTQTSPIIFTAGIDFATQGMLQKIARPECNTTQFTSAIDSITGKWLAMLKEIAPSLIRAAIMHLEMGLPTLDGPNEVTA